MAIKSWTQPYRRGEVLPVQTKVPPKPKPSAMVLQPEDVHEAVELLFAKNFKDQKVLEVQYVVGVDKLSLSVLCENKSPSSSG